MAELQTDRYTRNQGKREFVNLYMVLELGFVNVIISNLTQKARS
jgi:hypothetical protein